MSKHDDSCLPATPVRGGLRLRVGDETVDVEVGVTYSASGSGKADLCFVFDTTGSMSDKIDGLVSSMSAFVQKLAELSLDWRMTVVPFGDLTIPGDDVVTTLPFTSDREAGQKMLRIMPRFSGGGNEGESSVKAVSAALQKAYREDAVKVLFLLTDEPALSSEVSSVPVEQQLLGSEALIFVASPPLDYFKRWAVSSGGEWFPIGNTVDTKSILALLERIATVAHEVHLLAGGSVTRYRELRGGSE